ncbi:MAG TPA: sigma 54-interacting transcriptional regulator [Gemmatimonadales bacterium]|nr:sigma 54-interacting transcriptional regulator [Gemmatimonadales bacterium]
MVEPSKSTIDCDAVLLGKSEVMRRVHEQLITLAGLPWHVRIEGPSGTGKSVAARLLHKLSHRAQAAFILCSLASLPDSTAIGELVGYRRGAFTGAYENHAGKFEAAHNGTLFLDEIGTAGPEVQRALLQFVDTGIVQRLGEVRERPVDARLVFATNESLATLVTSGRFRSDLYYRMGQLVVRMPALAEHAEDIPLIMEHMLAAKAQEAGIPAPVLTAADWERLMGYHWPGNVRELAGVAEQIVVFGQVPETIARNPLTGRWREQLPEVLRQCGGNQSAAARRLGVSRQSLQRALQKEA